jgi:RNA polymerase sigma-70 factor (ECF subfamily)
MAAIPAKHRATIDEAVERLISRAENARGLTGGDIVGRVEAALAKYLFKDDPNAGNAEIKAFIDDIRADDLCLVIACERGDEAAWEALVQQFDPTVKSAARKAASNAEDAEDLASSIWAELYGLRTDADGNKKSKLAYYSGRGSLGGWLRAVTAQLAVDGFRKQAKYVQIEEDREFENLANEAAGDGELIAHDPSPEELLTDRRTAEDVTEALAQTVAELEPEDRLIMKLYYFDELKLKQIADTFGYHEATASRKLARIQSEIRKGVERTLKNKHGWTDNEVKKYLSETAESLGVSLETMFAAITLAVLLQEIWL